MILTFLYLLIGLIVALASAVWVNAKYTEDIDPFLIVILVIGWPFVTFMTVLFGIGKGILYLAKKINKLIGR